jgi:hypothetical protein
MSFALIALTSLLLGAVADTVAESTLDGGERIVAFGRVLYAPGPTETLWILCAASAAVALAWTAAVAYARGRRLERRMAEELDGRWEELSHRSAGTESRSALLEWRVVELQNQVNELLAQRDRAVDEMVAIRDRTAELQLMIDERNRELSRRPEPDRPGLVAVPDVDGPPPGLTAADTATSEPA